ncbi:hypothetical protein TCON_1210 [Astathelohania contejeani]|uniref:Uncharacterized protein n=1 Tax=Astathelohania contejeani TaxID=164912 RepID=A0ABQ7HZI9_9MICR|nr:hypothetical protein TCON_1210 [Thelohania contejeani]
MSNSNDEKLVTEFMRIQNQLDEKYTLLLREEFELKYKHHQSIRPILDERTMLFKKWQETNDFDHFWSQAILKYEIGVDILPVDSAGNPASDWIKDLKVDYEPGYFCNVEIVVKENEFIENKILTKRFSVENNEREVTKLIWKNKTSAPIFEFFENDEDELEIFDVLYELYVNGIFYFTFNSE